jgi:hypothetical protein
VSCRINTGWLVVWLPQIIIARTYVPVEVLPHGRFAGAWRIWVRHDLYNRQLRCIYHTCRQQVDVVQFEACMHMARHRTGENGRSVYVWQGVPFDQYQRVEVVAAAGDADKRRRCGGRGLEQDPVADVLGAVGDGHADGGHEQVHHLSDHAPHHQRISEPGHAACFLILSRSSLLLLFFCCADDFCLRKLRVLFIVPKKKPPLRTW